MTVLWVVGAYLARLFFSFFNFSFGISYWSEALAQLVLALPYSRNVSISILDGVVMEFHRLNPSGCAVALGSTHDYNRFSYKEYFVGVKADRLAIWEP